MSRYIKGSFKPGDTVKCIDPGHNDLDLGKDYVIASISEPQYLEAQYLEAVVTLKGASHSYYAWRFELTHKFKVGDIVKYVPQYGYTDSYAKKLLTVGKKLYRHESTNKLS